MEQEGQIERTDKPACANSISSCQLTFASGNTWSATCECFGWAVSRDKQAMPKPRSAAFSTARPHQGSPVMPTLFVVTVSASKASSQSHRHLLKFSDTRVACHDSMHPLYSGRRHPLQGPFDVSCVCHLIIERATSMVLE